MENDEMKQAMNSGTLVEGLKRWPKGLTVREIPIEGVQSIAQELGKLLGPLDPETLPDGENVEWLHRLVKQADLVSPIKAVLAASTGLEKSEFDGLGITDTMKLVREFANENDLAELARLFFDLVKSLPKQTTATQQSP